MGRKLAELKEDTLSEVIVEDRLNHLLDVAGMKGRVGFVRNYPLKMFMPKSLDLTRAESGFVEDQRPCQTFCSSESSTSARWLCWR